MPNIMDTSYHMELPGLIFVIGWEGILTVALVGSIVQCFRNKGMQGAVKLDDQPNIKKCPSCGNEYVQGTVIRCPKCGGMLHFDAFGPKE